MRNIAGQRASQRGANEESRQANLAWAVLTSVLKDLIGPSAKWRADAEQFFDDDHADIREHWCDAAGIPEPQLWNAYHRAKARVLAAGLPAGGDGAHSDAGGDRPRAAEVGETPDRLQREAS